jgi:hypothetical protein
MAIRSDNPAEVGLHVFEASNLGKAPFRVVGFEHKVGPIDLGNGHQVGAPGQPMGTCDYCGNGIADCFRIKSSDGETFVVGSTCVERTDDRNLIQAYKNNSDYRAKKRAVRHAREAKKIAELPVLIELHRTAMGSVPHPRKDKAADGFTMLDWAEWMFENAGNSGKCKMHSALKKFNPVGIDLEASAKSVAVAKKAYEKRVADAEAVVVAREAEQKEIANGAAKENEWLISVLNVAWGDFASDMAKSLESRPLNSFSPGQLNSMADIYAKSFGRRNSKKYNAAREEFETEAYPE